MNEEQEQKMLKYIDALEEVNDQVVIALKECVGRLSKYPPPGENPGKWNKMLKSLEDITALSNEITEKRQGLAH